jgi:DNA-directed RNA polymerase specialized sigma24 family protein
VEEPLPDSTRAARGAAFLHAREAVTSAKSSPWHLRVVDGTGAGPARALETTLWLWAAVLARRTPRGWEVADLVEGEGLSYEEAGRRLGISQSAVSQRAQPAGIVEGRRARELVTYLAGQLMTPPEAGS